MPVATSGAMFGYRAGACVVVMDIVGIGTVLSNGWPAGRDARPVNDESVCMISSPAQEAPLPLRGSSGRGVRITVPSPSPWVSTGISLVDGTRVSVATSGEWRLNRNDPNEVANDVNGDLDML